MRRLLAAVLLAAAAALPARSAPEAATPASAPLGAAVDALVRSEPDRWGVLAVALDSGKVVYRHNADALFQPASNQKVFTTAAAIDALGPAWTTRTTIYATTEPDDGVLDGDLVLYGRGDPNLSGRFSTSNDPIEPLRQLAGQVRARGITRVTGGLVADESYLSGPPHGSGWAWEDLQWHFGAEVSALSFNDNLATVRVTPGAAPGEPAVVTIVPDVGYLRVDNQTVTVAGSGSSVSVNASIDNGTVTIGGEVGARNGGWNGEVSVHDPALYAAAAMRRALVDAGVEVVGPSRKLDAYMVRPEALAIDDLLEVAAIDSQPLSVMTQVVNKHSQNLHAELILRLLGRTRGPADLPSDQAGIAVVTDFLRRAGLLVPGAVLFDGSGLSRLDRVSPGMLEGVMRAMAASPSSAVFFDTLPVAGVDGTLRHRLGGLQVHAKTGSLQTAKSLTGYATDASGRRIAFSIVYNNPANSGGAIGQIDRIAAAIARSSSQ